METQTASTQWPWLTHVYWPGSLTSCKHLVKNCAPDWTPFLQMIEVELLQIHINTFGNQRNRLQTKVRPEISNNQPVDQFNNLTKLQVNSYEIQQSS